MSSQFNDQMHSIQSLLQEKNRYLECFVELNANELHKFSDGRFEHVEAFYQTRERILDIIKCLDILIQEQVEQMAGESLPSELCLQVKALMSQKDELAKQIIEQDQRILSCIETERNKVLEQINATQFSKKVVGAYGLPERRTNLNQQFDDKA